MNRKFLTNTYRVSGAVALLLWVVLAILSQRGAMDVQKFVLITVGASVAVLTALYTKLKLMNVPRTRIYGLMLMFVSGFSVVAVSILFRS